MLTENIKKKKKIALLSVFIVKIPITEFTKNNIQETKIHGRSLKILIIENVTTD